MNWSIITTLLMLNILVRSEDDEPVWDVETTTPPLYCKKEYLEAYGLIGSDEPILMELPMCPNVAQSCCVYADQVTIFEHWVHSKEYRHLLDRFEYHESIYNRVIEEAVQVHDHANDVLKKLKREKVSNCKILAKRIVQLEFKSIAMRLKVAIKEMHKFFETSYKGFYCALCDAENHKYFLNDTIEIVYSQKFCRDMTSKTLNVLLYFHTHLMKYLNMLLKFSRNCDSEGRYMPQPISNDELFFAIQKDRKILEKCRDFRNTNTWFEECQPICNKFNINTFHVFFEPHLKKYKLFGQILNQANKDFIVANNQIEPDTSNQDQKRVLEDVKIEVETEEEGKKGSMQISEEEVSINFNPFPSQEVILSGDNSFYDLGDYDNKFDKQGISLYQIGEIALIDQLTMDTVLAEIARMAQEQNAASRPFQRIVTMLLILIMIN